MQKQFNEQQSLELASNKLNPFDIWQNFLRAFFLITILLQFTILFYEPGLPLIGKISLPLGFIFLIMNTLAYGRHNVRDFVENSKIDLFRN